MNVIDFHVTKILSEKYGKVYELYGMTLEKAQSHPKSSWREYLLNGSVHAEYRLRSFDDCCKCLVDWRLTEEEQEIILDKMEEYCMQETGKTLQELWDSYEAE